MPHLPSYEQYRLDVKNWRALAVLSWLPDNICLQMTPAEFLLATANLPDYILIEDVSCWKPNIILGDDPGDTPHDIEAAYIAAGTTQAAQIAREADLRLAYATFHKRDYLSLVFPTMRDWIQESI